MPIRVCHLIGGARWTGAEVRAVHLLSGLALHHEIELSAILLSEGYLSDELRRSGIAVSVLPQTGRVRLLTNLTESLRCRPVAILHTHGYRENILGGLAGRMAGVRWFVRTRHRNSDPNDGRAPSIFIRRLLNDVFGRYATHWMIAGSEDIYSGLLKGFPRGQVAFIRDGLIPGNIKPTRDPGIVRQELGLGPAVPIFGTVGRLVPEKGLEYFLRASLEIHQEIPDARFIVVGAGPCQNDLERTVRELGVDSIVRFLGFRRDAIDLLNMLDVVVLPALSAGYEMVLFEAMALAKPIVASAMGGISEMLQNGGGWLVPPRDVSALARACIEAYRASRDGSGGQVPADQFDELESIASIMCHQTWALYQDLVKNG